MQGTCGAAASSHIKSHGTEWHSGQIGDDVKSMGHVFQIAVARPQLRSGREEARRDQMRISEADAFRVERVRFDHMPHFVEPGHLHGTQCVHFGKDFWAIAQRSQSDLRNDEGMHDDLARQKEIRHLRMVTAEMVNPDGRIGQDQSETSTTTRLSYA